jgi:uncharacterized iron-regulated membrane protein
MSTSARFFRWHRWLGWIIALQVLAWVAGGFAFSWLPFKSWVKAQETIAKPSQPLPPNWASLLARHLEQHTLAPVIAVSSTATANGPALRLRHADGDSWIGMDGKVLPPPDLAAVERFARSLYLGPVPSVSVNRLDSVPARALIVREAGDRRDVWRASFDDRLNTRLYFDGRSGELVAVRNSAWVLYDFFWRLHLMDYSDGEDFNHPLVKAASLLALALVITGLVLAGLALRRTWRQQVRRRHPAPPEAGGSGRG